MAVAMPERPQALSNLALRTLSSLVLVPLALFALWFGGAPFLALVAVAALLMLGEWASIAGAMRPRVWQMLVGAPLVYALWLATNGGTLESIGLALVATVVVAQVAAQIDKWVGPWSILGSLYVALPSVALVWLRQGAPALEGQDSPEAGFRIVVWLFGVVWASDIFAYVAGRSIGGPKLAPAISPGKTWAGLLGGMAGASVIGWAVGAFFGHASALSIGLASGGLAVVAQIGDLAESAFKRRFGVKDSGAIIPGHGGVLDRLDALLFVSVVVALGALVGWRFW